MAKGMFIGNSHANGGIPSEIAETGTKIEIEGNEYYICNEAYNSPNHFDFKKKTNKEILDFIYTEFACKLNQDIMHSGDFIVCKVVVADNRKKDRKGTIKQILNEMQGEKNCKVESSSNYFKKGGLIAPNGKKSNLTPDQYKLVRTPEFKKWFGDWQDSPETASKVLDENGEPLICYHATGYDFNVFKLSEIGKSIDYGTVGAGFYFTSSYENAKNYENSLSTNNPDIKETKIIKCFLNIRKIKVENSHTKFSGFNRKESEKYTEKLKTKGFDGIIIDIYFSRKDNYKWFVAFEPNQIKLADGTNTTFDSSNPDIRFKQGGELSKHKDIGISNDNNSLTVTKYILNRHPKKDDIFKGGKVDGYKIIKIKKIKKHFGIVYHILILDTKKNAEQKSNKRIITYNPEFKKISDFLESNLTATKGTYYTQWEDSELDSKMKQGGELIKRADGSYSKRGLWDNIRANIGSGRKPTKEMLKQEAIIKSMKTGGAITKSDINKLSVREFEQYLIEKYNSKVELSDYKKYIYLGRIEVPKQKRDLGIGSEIMSEIISYADYNDKKITLTPSKDYGASSVERLKDFYKKFGFIENKGRNKDFEISQLMYRVPVSNKYHLGGDMSKHLAPNGKPSNLTHEQWHLVRTDAFKQWFGDWEKLAYAKFKDSGMDEITLANLSKDVSKVVDENGEPLVVFHGTDKDFNVFKKADKFREDWGVKDYGMYFSSSILTAKEYSFESIDENKEYLEWNNKLDELKKKQEWENWAKLYEYGKDKFKRNDLPKNRKSIRIIECFLNIKNPFLINGKGRNWFIALKGSIDNAIKNKKDGMIASNIIEVFNEVQDTYVAFEPNQIKLADGTNTTFDSSNPDIRYKEGGKLELYHGSQKKFKNFKTNLVERTDYGWGIYFTDSEDVAKFYARRPFDRDVITKKITESKFNIDEKYLLIDTIRLNLLDLEKSKKTLDKKYYPLINQIQKEVQNKSFVYESNVLNKKWLYWDKKVSVDIKKIFKNIDDKYFKSGETFYNYLTDKQNSQKNASLFLLNKGIVGIKYLISNNGFDIDGYNYVLFDVNDIEIKEISKYDEGGNINTFNYDSLYNTSDEETERINEEIRLSEEQEKEDKYQKSSFSKKWAATRKIAIDKLVQQYLDAKKTYDDWASRQYKENKTNVFLGGDDIFGESKSIGSINEGRKRKVLKGSKMLMDESIADLKEIGLKDSEIDNLINKTNNDQQTLFNNGGMINFVDSNYYESGTLFNQ